MLIDKNKSKSRQTTGLPFIISRKLDIDRETIVEAMNSGLDNITDAQKLFLKIRRFSRVEAVDYESIKFLESESRKLKYPQLQ